MGECFVQKNVNKEVLTHRHVLRELVLNELNPPCGPKVQIPDRLYISEIVQSPYILLLIH